MPIVGSILAKVVDIQVPAIVANTGQSCRSPSFGHRNRCSNSDHNSHFFFKPFNVQDQTSMPMIYHWVCRGVLRQKSQELKRQESQDDKLDLLLLM
jgi:hypothetical protein